MLINTSSKGGLVSVLIDDHVPAELAADRRIILYLEEAYITIETDREGLENIHRALTYHLIDTSRTRVQPVKHDHVVVAVHPDEIIEVSHPTTQAGAEAIKAEILERQPDAMPIEVRTIREARGA